MLFGVKTTMPKDFYNALIITGTLHVVALSGMNISIIIRLLFDMLGAVLGKMLGVAFTLVGIIGFVLLVGPSPSVIRASIMGSLSILAVFLGRKDVPIVSLFLTGLGMLVFDWKLITTISFQLSFLATLGIILFGKAKQPQQPQKGSPSNSADSPFVAVLKDDLRVSLAAQVFTFPVIVYHFHRVSLISPFANMLVGWLIAPITYIGFAMVIAGLVFRPFGYVIGLIAWVPLTGFIAVISLLANVPLASLQW